MGDKIYLEVSNLLERIEKDYSFNTFYEIDDELFILNYKLDDIVVKDSVKDGTTKLEFNFCSCNSEPITYEYRLSKLDKLMLVNMIDSNTKIKFKIDPNDYEVLNSFAFPKLRLYSRNNGNDISLKLRMVNQSTIVIDN